MSAQVREARQAALELLGWRLDVLPLFGGTSWCVTVFNADYGARESFYRPTRSQAVDAALDFATQEEGTAMHGEKAPDTERAPAMEGAAE